MVIPPAIDDFAFVPLHRFVHDARVCGQHAGDVEKAQLVGQVDLEAGVPDKAPRGWTRRWCFLAD
jgi:hypothetical protein